MPEPKVEQVANPDLFRHLLYSGSVKDVYGVPGRDPYVFVFSDRYSIFDWGEMPDSLPGKGQALSVMGDLFFRQLGRADAWSGWQIPDSFPQAWRERLAGSALADSLRRRGLSHHSLGLVDMQGRAVSPGGLSNRLAVRALDRPPARSETRNGKIYWDYSAYETRPESALVPLEVVFRFGAPEGSSFLSRLESIPGYAQSFGFENTPRAGELFPYPIVEFFTKLEPTDRFLSREEAMAVAALRPEEMDELVNLSLLLALKLRDIFAPLGLELWDGKFEFAFLPGEQGPGGPAGSPSASGGKPTDGREGPRRPEASGHRSFLLVDSIGPDELRLIGPGGVHFSKEFLRRVYRGGPWYQAMETAKALAKERGQRDWKRICRNELSQEPERLPQAAFDCARLMYPSLADGLAMAFLGHHIYREVPDVAELCRRIKEVV